MQCPNATLSRAQNCGEQEEPGTDRNFQEGFQSHHAITNLPKHRLVRLVLMQQVQRQLDAIFDNDRPAMRRQCWQGEAGARGGRELSGGLSGAPFEQHALNDHEHKRMLGTTNGAG